MTPENDFDDIYSDCAAAVYRACLRSVSRPEVAEELTSDVFLQLHQSQQDVADEQLPEWLFTTAKRRAAAYWRSHYAEQRWIEIREKANSSGDRPAFSIDHLLGECAALRPVHCVCLILRFRHGMSRAEIAGHTGLSELQVKGHLQSALQLLRRYCGGSAESNAGAHLRTTTETAQAKQQRSPVAGSRFNQPTDDDQEFETQLEQHARRGVCPSPGLLFAAQEDVLPEADGAAIRSHVVGCQLCQTLLAGLAPAETELTPGQDARIHGRFVAALESADTTADAMETKHPAWRMFLPVTAIVLLAVGSVAGHRMIHKPDESVATPSAAAAATPAPSLPAADAFDFAESYAIAPLAPPPAGGPSQSNEAGNDVAVDTLSAAFRAYNRADFAAAAAAFVPVVAEHPNAGLPRLYLGISQLELNQNSEARENLQLAEALAAPGTKLSAEWYLAVAELRTGRMATAVPRLRAICALKTEYASRACELAAQAAAPR